MSTQNVIVQLAVSHQDIQLLRTTNDVLQYNPEVTDPRPANLLELQQEITSLPAIITPHQQTEGVIRCFNDLSEYDAVLPSKDDKVDKEPNMLEPRHCWHCCHPFDGPVIGLPLKVEGDVFTTEGQFCSYACARAYASYEKKHTKYESLLSLMYRSHISNTRDENGKVFLVPRAPPRSALKAFGGQLSITEFRNKSIQGEKYEKLPPHQIAVNSMYAENEYSKVKRLKIHMANEEKVKPSVTKQQPQTDVLNMLDKWS
jgi:hypothetical protein